jgi:hypothetical protein
MKHHVTAASASLFLIAAVPCIAQPVPGGGSARGVNPIVAGPGVADAARGCRPGFVRRVATAADMVCVTAEARGRVANENRASNRTREADGSCRPGFVRRDALEGDAVCVTPQSRELAQEENRLDASRRTP